MDTPLDYSQFEEGRNCNYWTLDRALQFEVRRTYTPDEFDWAADRLASFGETVGHTIAANADTIDSHPPELHTYDRDGTVVNDVEYHPAQFENERLVYESGIAHDVFHPPPGRESPMGHVHAAAMEHLLNYADSGLDCPVSMSIAAPLLLDRYADEPFDDWFERLTTREYDALRDVAMFLTEKQGGSDVGANETAAREVADGRYRLTGEKWFCSNLDADAALVLARRPGAPDGTAGLSLFFVPRELDDGQRNDYVFRRLKDKLGTKSVPTGEVVFDGAEGYLVGDPEEGFRYMTAMLNRTRLSVTFMGLGIAGRALLESKIHAANREAFGGPLVEKPLMRADLVDMAVEYEATLAFAFEAARALDGWARAEENASDADEQFRRMRLLLPLAKYRGTALGVDAASQAVEIQGGNGVVDGFVTHRLLRDAQVHPIWEGAENIMCLDVLRAMDREDAHEVALADIEGRLEAVTHPAVESLVDPVAAALDEVTDAADELLTADRDLAELHAKRFADSLFEVYTAGLLLEEAQLGLDRDGDARKAVVARRFVDSTLGDGPAVGAETAALEQFDAIVRFDDVAPAELVDGVETD